jgi:hypothetical protein
MAAPQAQGRRYAYIAVMGITGSGKSSFIKAATGYPGVVVGDSLNGCESLQVAMIADI